MVDSGLVPALVVVVVDVEALAGEGTAAAPVLEHRTAANLASVSEVLQGVGQGKLGRSDDGRLAWRANLHLS